MPELSELIVVAFVLFLVALIVVRVRGASPSVPMGEGRQAQQAISDEEYRASDEEYRAALHWGHCIRCRGRPHRLSWLLWQKCEECEAPHCWSCRMRALRWGWTVHKWTCQYCGHVHQYQTEIRFGP